MVLLEYLDGRDLCKEILIGWKEHLQSVYCEWGFL